MNANSLSANEVLANLNKLSEASKASGQVRHRFFKADLSLVADTENIAKELITEASPSGINHLVMCQGRLSPVLSQKMQSFTCY